MASSNAISPISKSVIMMPGAAVAVTAKELEDPGNASYLSEGVKEPHICQKESITK